MLSATITRFAARAALACAVVLVAPHVSAQAADDATRAAARSLGYEGISDFQAGNHAAAADKLDRAYRALQVPSLGLWSARAFEKTGKLVAASERYMEVQRLDPGRVEVQVQKQAQADAEADNAALVPRIPSIVILVEGATADQVSVSVNGAPVPSSLLGVKRLVDPGTVRVDGKHAGTTASQSVTLGEGETQSVTLRFSAGTSALPAAADSSGASGASAGNTTASGPTDSSKPPSGSGRRTVGWIVLGAGGAGILTGAITGGLAMSTRSSTKGCDGTVCPPSERDDVETYNRYRTISTIGFIAGGALAATGAVLILTAPSSSPEKQMSSVYRLSPWLGIGGAGLVLEVER